MYARHGECDDNEDGLEGAGGFVDAGVRAAAPSVSL